MTVRCLIFFLLFPLTGFGQQQFYGTQVSALSLSGAERQDDLQLIPLRVGSTIDPANLRSAIQTLFDTGRYADISVDAVRELGGTRLTFLVRPHYYFSTFQLQPEKLLDRSISGFFRLPIGERYSESVVNRLAADSAKLLIEEGYLDARVTPETRFDNKTRLATVTLNATVRRKARIGQVKISGAEETFTPNELAEAFLLKAGDDFLLQKYESGLRRIREKFVNLDVGAFLNTRIDVERVDRAATNTIDFTLKIDPGQFTLVEVTGYSVPQKKLKTLIPIFEEGSVDTDLVAEGGTNLRSFMQQEGFFDASVQSDIITAPLDNAVQVNYKVQKGVPHRIDAVRIVGSTAFSEEVIKQRLKVQAAGLFGVGVFSPELLERDADAIRSLYREAGFENTLVEGASIERAHALEVVFSITEGSRSPIESIMFAGNVKVSSSELLERSGLATGTLYTPAELDNARAALMSMYYAKGFPDAAIETDSHRLAGSVGVAVTFAIVEGESFRIGRILVSGNTLTQEKIVHRNSNLYEGTAYNPEAVLDSQQKLYATGLFTRVDIVTLQQNSKDVRNVLIQVEDGNPILLTPSIGFKESEGPRATFEIAHSNLFGFDRSISLRLRGSLRGGKPGQLLLQSTYREPKLFNRNVEGYASVFAERTHQKQFDASRVDFSIQAIRRLSASKSFLQLTASYQTVNPSDIRVNPRAPQFPEGGTIQIARLGGLFVRDRRDDSINPSHGSFETTSFQVASRALKSEINFTSFFNQSTFYRRVRKAVLAAAVRVGWNQPFGQTRQLPITERYFAGGSTTLRGFSQDDAGPEGGGNAITIGNLEYRFPLPVFWLKDLGGAVFYDTGNTFPGIRDVKLSNFTHTGGAGLRYDTPLGPVRFDIGVNLYPRIRLDGQRDKRIKLFFTLGHTF